MTVNIYSNTTSPTYTVTAGGAVGASGAVLQSNGSSWNWNSTITADPSLNGSTLKVTGDANISGELTIQGVKLSDRLDKIEQRLNILRPNEELEEKWDNLRALGQAYRELEKEIIEKQEMWAILKK
jgi:hypothetical protein